MIKRLVAVLALFLAIEGVVGGYSNWKWLWVGFLLWVAWETFQDCAKAEKKIYQEYVVNEKAGKVSWVAWVWGS